MTFFEEIDDDEVVEYRARAEEEAARVRHGNRGGGGYQCHCGRWARHISTRHHYNGTWDLISVDLDCSRCGPVTIECV